MSTDPVVSVAMLTFNQVTFVRQAVESSLKQVTNFPVEIVIGDDSSTDGTRDILTELQQAYPRRIRILDRPDRVGVNQNLVDVLCACRGKYISLLEGDDFWLGTEKLARQVEFLEMNPRFSSVHHNVFCQQESDERTRTLMHTRPGPLRQCDLLRSNPVGTCSIMFRNGLYDPYPDWFLEVPSPDWALHMLNSRHGDIGYIDSVWGVYRLRADSYWSSRPRLDILAGQIETATALLRCLDEPMQACLRETIRSWHEENVELLIRDGKHEEAQSYADENLSDLAVLKRLSLFFSAIEHEQSGKKIRAARGYLKTLFTAPGRTRIRTRDVLLALFRSVSPSFIYRSARALCRKFRSRTS